MAVFKLVYPYFNWNLINTLNPFCNGDSSCISYTSSFPFFSGFSETKTNRAAYSQPVSNETDCFCIACFFELWQLGIFFTTSDRSFYNKLFQTLIFIQLNKVCTHWKPSETGLNPPSKGCHLVPNTGTIPHKPQTGVNGPIAPKKVSTIWVPNNSFPPGTSKNDNQWD